MERQPSSSNPEQSETESTPSVPVSPGGVGRILPTPNQLVSFGERLTYTFAVGDEVGSIHYDASKKEIFLKGHNIHNIDLEEWQMKVLDELRGIIAADPQANKFAESYSRTLDKILTQKKSS